MYKLYSEQRIEEGKIVFKKPVKRDVEEDSSNKSEESASTKKAKLQSESLKKLPEKKDQRLLSFAEDEPEIGFSDSDSE